jgi:hypothetical protein
VLRFLEQSGGCGFGETACDGPADNHGTGKELVQYIEMVKMFQKILLSCREIGRVTSVDNHIGKELFIGVRRTFAGKTEYVLCFQLNV